MSDDFIIRFSQVLYVHDDQAGLRIKVRLKYEDTDVAEDRDLPYCYPLLPKMLHVNPKVGELVLVILQTQGQSKGNRFFIGPFIAQPYNLKWGNYFQDQCLFNGVNNVKPGPNPALNPANNGTLPDREDIALQGRDNADVILKPKEVLLRCGFKKLGHGAHNTLNFNDKDLAYIQLKYGQFKDEKDNSFSSVANIVADRINLLSHDSGTYFDLGDNEQLITEETLSKILKNAHPLVYGDNLVEFLMLFVNAFLHHEHKWAQYTPTQTEMIDKLNIEMQTIKQKMLSPSIKIN